MSEIPVIRQIMFLAVVTTGLTLWFESPAAAVNATDVCFVETGIDDSSTKLRKRLADWTAEDPDGTIAVWTGTKVEHASDPVTIGWAIDWFFTQPLCTLIVVNTKPPRLPIFVVHADNPDGASQTALLVAGMLASRTSWSTCTASTVLGMIACRN